MYYKDNIDLIFVIGIFLDIIFICILPFIIKYIIKLINDIKEL